MKVLFAASEAIPFAKTGGLADVTGTLSRVLRDQGVDARLIIPLYKGIQKRFELTDTGIEITIPIGKTPHKGRVYSDGGSNYFIRCDEFFDRKHIYGDSRGEYPDNAERFIFFSRAVLEAAALLEFKPDVIHAHDWQTALIPLYVKTLYKREFKGTPCVFTIHNLGYQGIHPPSIMAMTGLGPEWFTPECLEFFGQANLLKAGIVAANAITTVSEHYASEIIEKTSGAGLDGVLRSRQSHLTGILNGIDYNEWDPGTDENLPQNYSADNLGPRAECTKALIAECSLEGGGGPIAGFVGRLSGQKGVDFILDAASDLLASGVRLVVLGKGEDSLQRRLKGLSRKHPRRVFVSTGYDEGLARRIYAGADMMLMPSLYEPCGLVQMIAMRYGSVPVARATGGLIDTIEDYDHLSGEGTGFLFEGLEHHAFTQCVKRAISVFADNKQWTSLQRRCMKIRFDWKEPALKYMSLYETLAGGRAK